MKVKLFARARDLAGAASVEVTLAAGATIRDLRLALARAHPALTPLLAHCAFAVGGNFVQDDSVADAAAEVALIPPVSGG